MIEKTVYLDFLRKYPFVLPKKGVLQNVWLYVRLYDVSMNKCIVETRTKEQIRYNLASDEECLYLSI